MRLDFFIYLANATKLYCRKQNKHFKKTVQCQLIEWYKTLRVLRENSDLRPDYAESKTSLIKYSIKMTFSNQKEIIYKILELEAKMNSLLPRSGVENEAQKRG